MATTTSDPSKSSVAWSSTSQQTASNLGSDVNSDGTFDKLRYRALTFTPDWGVANRFLIIAAPVLVLAGATVTRMMDGRGNARNGSVSKQQEAAVWGVTSLDGDQALSLHVGNLSSSRRFTGDKKKKENGGSETAIVELCAAQALWDPRSRRVGARVCVCVSSNWVGEKAKG